MTICLLFKQKWMWALIVTLIAVVLNHATQQIPIKLFHFNKADARAIRILEYNICGKGSYEAKHGAEFISYILQQDADILILPENTVYRAKELDSVLVKHYPYNLYSTIEKGKRPEIASVFSKYPMSDVVRLYDPITQKLSNNNIRAVVDIDGKKITMLSIHASSNGRGIKQGYSNREQELEILKQEIRNRNTSYCIVVGDFNDLSGSKFIGTLQNEKLKDAWWEYGCGPGFTFREGLRLFRLDHILVSNDIIVNKICVDSKISYSDHFPLITEIIIK